MTSKHQRKKQSDQNEDYKAAEQRENTVTEYEEYVLKECKRLVKEYLVFQSRTGKRLSSLTQNSSPWEAYLKWHEYNLEQRDQLDFTGLEDHTVSYLYSAASGKNVEQLVKKAPIYASDIDIFKNFEGFVAQRGGVKAWDMRISNKALSKLKMMQPDQLPNTLRSLFTLQLGYMSDAQIIDTGPILYLAGFSKMIRNDQVIVFAVVPERVPIIQYLYNEPVLSGFYYRQYLRIIDITKKTDARSRNASYDGFVNHIQGDPDKWSPFVISQYFNEQKGDEAMTAFSANSQLLAINNIVSVGAYSSCVHYYPTLTKKHQLTKQEIRAFQFTKGRWLSEMEQSKLSFSIQPNLKNTNKEIIEKCTSEASCIWLLSFLEKIPSFKLKLTDEERLLITTSGNVLCLGRSGTGKTTSAVLRLFALELLFKVRSSFFFKKDEGHSLQDSRNFTASDVQSNTGLHSVIVTASPVLTNEIRRFYQSFTSKIIEALKKKEMRQKEKQKEEDDQIITSALQQEQQEDNELMEDLHGGEEEEEPNIDDELMDATEVEKNLNMPHSMDDMKNEDFPAFLTIKRLIYMIDASLQRPFFVRNAKNEIIGQDSQAEWHSEQKGILMINNYYKNNEEKRRGGGNDIDEIERFMDLSSSDDSSDEEGNNIAEIGEIVEQQVQKSKRKKNKQDKGGDSHIQEFAQEVDYELFEKKFWPKVGHYRMNCASTWTEIFSIIKGSHNSSEYPKMALPFEMYEKATGIKQKNSEEDSRVEATDRWRTYQIYNEYENWKKQIKGFDAMDIVNHVLREVQGLRYFGAPIHFMLVDEVQDLTPATIRLLLKVTEQNVYFAGDTAQTIARGVGFRFCDLKKMVNMNEFEAPKVLQLTVNFRSHNEILKLANTIIGAIEIFFPHTIDKLLKERSHITGLRPIVLDSNLLESLFYILTGDKKHQSEEGKDQKVDFGCDQVIIVRDQEAKSRIPSQLQHALCLTVYEAKGLEFEDVILFNFFSDSKIGKQQWVVMHDIKVKQQATNIQQEQSKHQPKVQTLDELQTKEDEEEKQREKQKEEEEEEEKESLLSPNRGMTDSQSDSYYVSYKRPNMHKEYAALCTELKQLYVCVTRPKKRLLIFDQDSTTANENREEILKYWVKAGAVDIVTESMIKQSLEKEGMLTQEQKRIFEKIAESKPALSKELNAKELQDQKEQREKGWKLQGIKMFKRRYYEQAIKCFQNAGIEDLRLRAKAYFLAEKGSKLMSDFDTIKNRLEDFSGTITKQEKKSLKAEQKEMKEKAEKAFNDASEVFEEIGLKKQAAQCYFTSENYKKAAFLFEQIGFYAQAGESYYILGDFNKAAQLYSEGKAVTQAVNCYKKMKNWDAILNCVKMNEDEFSQEQREKLISKYVPLALNSLYHIVIKDTFEEGESEEEGGDVDILIPGLQHQKSGPVVVNDYDQVTQSKIIQEKEEEEEEDDEEEEEEKEEGREESQQEEAESQGVSIVQEEEDLNVSSEKHNIEVQEEEKGNEKKQKSKSHQKQKEQQQISFEIISESAAASDKSNVMDTFEHLSQFDPEDEFIRSRPVSIIDSVISGEYKNSDSKSDLSCYSIVESQQAAITNQHAFDALMQNVNLIKTKRDIYAEDLLMAKIVYYVSQFSSDVKSFLSKFRSKEVLLSQKQQPNVNKEPTKQQQIQEQEIIQIDTRANKDEYPLYSKNQDDEEMAAYDIDDFNEEFINVILDCLESFELYKLCIIVCNRYKLKERIGRYLVSIAHKYSNIPVIYSKYITLFHKDHKEVQEQVSFISHHAIHSALELIEPEYLKIGSENSLGQYCYTALMNLGLWKKLLYLTDLQSSLQVASSFSDFKNFRKLYLTFYLKQNESITIEQLNTFMNKNSFEFIGQNLTEGPTNAIEYLAYKTALDSIVWNFLDNSIGNDNIDYPSFLELTQNMISIKRSPLLPNQKTIKTEELLDQIEDTINRSLKHQLAVQNVYLQKIKLYDGCIALGMLFQSEFKYSIQSTDLLQDFSKGSFKILVRLLTLILGLFKRSDLNGSKYLTSSNISVAMYGLFSVLKIKELEKCQALYDNYGDKVLVHWTSPLAQELTKEVEDRKRKLTEQVSKDVFSQNDVEFISKRELNKLIRDQLRTALQKESIESQIDIVDLDANFMRVPVQLVVQKYFQKMISIFKKVSSKQINAQDVSQFEKHTQIDLLESPFEVDEYVTKLTQYLCKSQDISNFFYKLKDQQLDWKATLEKRIKDLFIEKADICKDDTQFGTTSKYSNYDQFLLNAGLITEEYLENQKKKKIKHLQKKDIIGDAIFNFSKDLAFISVVNFKPASKFEDFSRNCYLQLAQSYWTVFIYSQDSNKQEDTDKHFNLALNALSLSITGEYYLYFMETLQNTLSKSSIERKLLLILLDAHIYQQSGDFMQSSNSLLSFISYQQEQHVMMSQFYLNNYLELAVVYFIAADIRKQKAGIYLPFELCRHLSIFFNDIEHNDQVSFNHQLEQLNSESEEEIKLTLNLKNKKYATTLELDKQKSLLEALVNKVCKNIFETEKPFYQAHLFYMLISIVINLPQQIQQASANLINKAFERLQLTNVISEDHSIFDYQKYQEYAKDFTQLNSIDQNDVLYIIEKESQSVFVHITFTNIFSEDELKQRIEGNLKVADVKEQSLIQAHQKSFKKLQNFKHKCSKKLRSIQNAKKLNSFNYEGHLLLAKILNNEINNKAIKQNFQQLKAYVNDALELSKLNKFIGGVILNTTLDNVIDFHYLLSQKEKTEKEYLPAIQNQINKLIWEEEKGEQILQNAKYNEEIKESIKDIWQQVNIWSQSKYVPNTGVLEKNQKIMKLKWKEHALRAKQKMLARVAGIKKQGALEAKKQRIKKRGKNVEYDLLVLKD